MAKARPAKHKPVVAETPAILKGAYTVKKKCIDCGAIRMCKPQDAWQVKRCVPCQDKRRGVKLTKLIERKASPDGKREEAKKRVHAKLDAYVKNNEEAIDSSRRYRERIEREHAARPKPRRIWPSK